MAINGMTAPCIVQYISWCVTWRPYEQNRGTASFLSRLSRHSRTVWDDDVKTQMTLFSKCCHDLIQCDLSVTELCLHENESQPHAAVGLSRHNVDGAQRSPCAIYGRCIQFYSHFGAAYCSVILNCLKL